MRYFFDISYDGTNYHGWQRQENAICIQQIIEEKLSTIFAEKLEIVGSGRTDKGVHARQQIFHVDISSEFNVVDKLHQCNSFLPKDIALNGIRHVTPEAHARFDATMRRYEYFISTKKNPFLDNYAHKLNPPQDFNRLNEISQVLVGEKNFEAFSKVKTDVQNFDCEIFQLNWSLETELLTFKISANRFLRGMVRAIVGTLLEALDNDDPVNFLEEIISSKDRRRAGPSVPAKGLYLVEVAYPDNIYIDGTQ